MNGCTLHRRNWLYYRAGADLASADLQL